GPGHAAADDVEFLCHAAEIAKPGHKEKGAPVRHPRSGMGYCPGAGLVPSTCAPDSCTAAGVGVASSGLGQRVKTMKASAAATRAMAMPVRAGLWRLA